jgi:uncharacterized protein YmfQ (DUF2313 family)
VSFLDSLTSADFAQAVARLFPRGRAFPGDPDTQLARLNQALADAIFTVHVADVQLLEQEADPYYTINLLPDWETDFGLPDPCSAPNPTIDQRRKALLSKIASIGGQSRAYYIGVAAALGFSITIYEYRTFRLGVLHLGDLLCGPGWEFVWRVDAPQITVDRFKLGVSALGEAFWTIGNTELECRLRSIMPAHTILIFNYS